MEEKKRRRALTDADRLIIRKRNQTHALGTQELIDWFITTARNPLSQSQVSKVLGSQYDYLDGEYTKKDIQKLKSKIRSSGGDWPDLDHALFEWQQHMEQKKAIITGEILKTKAK
jgi:exoribonuclease II